MRLKLTLKPENEEYILPLNYQYYLYISFFIIFDNSSEEFRKWVKEKYFSNRNGRFYMYNFSFLYFLNERSVDITNATISSSGDIELTFTAPILDEDIKNYIIELFNNNDIHFYPAKRENQEFVISKVEEIDLPEFKEEMNYKMSSVTCYFTKNYRHFFNIGEKGIEDKLIYDLKQKYKKVYNKEYEGEISLEFDKEYQENHKVNKLITMKENTEDEYKIRGFNCPFTLKASPDMQYIAYTCGIGMKNKFGFGSIEINNDIKKNTENPESKKGLLSKIFSIFK